MRVEAALSPPMMLARTPSPLIATAEHIDEMVALLDRSMGEVLQDLRP